MVKRSTAQALRYKKTAAPTRFQGECHGILFIYNQRSRRRIDLCRHIICPSAAHAASGVTLRRHLTRCEVFSLRSVPLLYHHPPTLASTILEKTQFFITPPLFSYQRIIISKIPLRYCFAGTRPRCASYLKSKIVNRRWNTAQGCWTKERGQRERCPLRCACAAPWA